MIVAGLKTHHKLKGLLYSNIPGMTLYFLQTILQCLSEWDWTSIKHCIDK